MDDKKGVVKRDDIDRANNGFILSSIMALSGRVGAIEGLDLRKIREKVLLQGKSIDSLMDEHRVLKDYAESSDKKATASRKKNLEVMEEQGRTIEEFKRETSQKHEELKQDFSEKHKTTSGDLAIIKESISGILELQKNAKKGWGFIKWLCIAFVSVLGVVSLGVGVVLGLLNIKIKLSGGV